MENTNIGQRTTSSSQELSEPTVCWICLCTDNDYDDDENNGNWVSPCKCRGSSRWVHQGCLLHWIAEKLNDNRTFKVHCPQCLTQYIIVYDKVNFLVRLLNIFGRTANQMAPILTQGVLLIIVYWSAACYGAITIMQIMSEREAITMMENTNPYVLLLILPTIPVSLAVGKMFNWQETLMLFVQKFTQQLPLLRTIVPSFLYGPVYSPVGTVPVFRAIPATSFCSALLFPTNSIVVGKLFFGNSSYSFLRKTVLGGLLYLAVQLVVRIYQRQQNIIKEKTLRVIEYPNTHNEENN